MRGAACVFCGCADTFNVPVLAACAAVGCAHRMGRHDSKEGPARLHVCRVCHPHVTPLNASARIVNLDYVRCPWHRPLSPGELAAVTLERESGRIVAGFVRRDFADFQNKLIEQLKTLRPIKDFGKVEFRPRPLAPRAFLANHAHVMATR